MRSSHRFAVGLMLTALLWQWSPASADTGAVERGRRALAAGEYPEAATAFREALAEDSGNREARIGLARALGFSGDFEGGEREYRALLAVHPEDVEARFGLADLLAWQKRYGESRSYLSALARERPEDPRVWTRLGKVELWSGNDPSARTHFERALSLDPTDAEARRGMELLEAKASRSYRREASIGASRVRIRNANPGSGIFAAVRDRAAAGWEFLGKAEYLHRFGKDEGRGSAGVVRKWPAGGSLRVEGGLAPDAEILARASIEAEAAWPVRQGLVGYAGGKFADYAQAGSWNAVAAVEYYLPGRIALFARYIYSRTEFDAGGSSDDGSWTLRLTHFRTDDDRAWVYYSRGTEGYTTGTADQIGNLSSDTWGVGGRIFPRPRWGLEGNVEWQDREDGNDYWTFTATTYRRF